MPNNSKLPPQVQPSRLDIISTNVGQMNLETAIGRLEQAVTKAYGNINSSINSKQGEFNQALLKTLDQSISKTSDKMDVLFTNSFSKIYALNSVLMEQSLQKNGMVAAQRDLDTFKNYDKLFENQQKAFGDMNVSLKQIIEKIDNPLNKEDYLKQQTIQNGNFVATRNMKYSDISAFLQTTAINGVGRVEALANADNVNKNLFQKRNTKEFIKNPMIKALVASDDTALKELQGATDFSKFWMILIEKLSKAKDKNNEEVMQELQKFFKTDGMIATATDPRITALKAKEKPKNNLRERILNRAQQEENANLEMSKKGSLTTNLEKAQLDYLTKLLTLMSNLESSQDKDNKTITDNYKDSSKLTKNAVSEQTAKETAGTVSKSSAAQFAVALFKFFPDIKIEGVNVSLSGVVQGGADILDSVYTTAVAAHAAFEAGQAINKTAVSTPDKNRVKKERQERAEWVQHEQNIVNNAPIPKGFVSKDMEKANPTGDYDLARLLQQKAELQQRLKESVWGYDEDIAQEIKKTDQKIHDLQQIIQMERQARARDQINSNKNTLKEQPSSKSGSLSAIHSKTPYSTQQSVDIKRNDNLPISYPNNYNSNSQLIKQILNMPRTMHQKFDMSFTFNQNGSGTIQHSFESSTPISPRGDSPVIQHRSHQTDKATR